MIRRAAWGSPQSGIGRRPVRWFGFVLGAPGGRRNVTVNGRSDYSWTVRADRDWIGVSPSSVLGGATVEVRVG